MALGEGCNEDVVKRKASPLTPYALDLTVFQWPILGPVAFSPADTSLNRTVDPQCGHFPRMVSSSRRSY